MMDHSDLASRVAGIAALDDPTRRRLYEFVVGRARLVGRDEAAGAVGIPRSTAAFHLDRLAEVGLLDVEFRRLTGRRGPGAGRPSKLYRRAQREVAVSVPERRYDLAGQLLAQAITESREKDVPLREALARAAFTAGRSLGQEAHERASSARAAGRNMHLMEDVLRECGFEPRRDGADVILGNCPFKALSDEYTELVCGMNVHLVEGVIEGLGLADTDALLEPQPGSCCVRIFGA